MKHDSDVFPVSSLGSATGRCWHRVGVISVATIVGIAAWNSSASQPSKHHPGDPSVIITPDQLLPETEELLGRYGSLVQDPNARGTQPFVAKHLELLGDVRALLDTDTPLRDRLLLRQRAVDIAFGAEHYRVARELARDWYHETLLVDPAGLHPHASANSSDAHAYLVRCAIAADLAEHSTEADREEAVREIMSLTDRWRDRPPVDSPTSSFFLFHTLVFAGEHLRRINRFAEAAEAYEVAVDYGISLSERDPSIDLGWKPGHALANQVLSLLENGDGPGARLAFSRFASITAEQNGGQSIADALQHLLTKPSRVVSKHAPERRQLVLDWMERPEFVFSGPSEIALVGWLVSRIRTGESVTDAERHRGLALLERALNADEAVLRASDRLSQRRMKLNPTATQGYAARPDTAELHVKRFMLADAVGDHDAATESARVILRDYPDHPAMPGVAGWHQRHAHLESKP